MEAVAGPARHGARAGSVAPRHPPRRRTAPPGGRAGCPRRRRAVVRHGQRQSRRRPPLHARAPSRARRRQVGDAAARQRMAVLENGELRGACAPRSTWRSELPSRSGTDEVRRPSTRRGPGSAAEPRRRRVHECDDAAAVHDAGPALKRLAAPRACRARRPRARGACIERLRDGVQRRAYSRACYTRRESLATRVMGAAILRLGETGRNARDPRARARRRGPFARATLHRTSSSWRASAVSSSCRCTSISLGGTEAADRPGPGRLQRRRHSVPAVDRPLARSCRAPLLHDARRVPAHRLLGRLPRRATRWLCWPRSASSRGWASRPSSSRTTCTWSTSCRWSAAAGRSASTASPASSAPRSRPSRGDHRAPPRASTGSSRCPCCWVGVAGLARVHDARHPARRAWAMDRGSARCAAGLAEILRLHMALDLLLRARHRASCSPSCRPSASASASTSVSLFYTAYAIAAVGVRVGGGNLIDTRGRRAAIIPSMFVQAAAAGAPDRDGALGAAARDRARSCRFSSWPGSWPAPPTASSTRRWRRS